MGKYTHIWCVYLSLYMYIILIYTILQLGLMIYTKMQEQSGVGGGKISFMFACLNAQNYITFCSMSLLFSQ